jgi:hypothetical protein
MDDANLGTAKSNIIRLKDFEQRWNGKRFRSFQLDAVRRKLTAHSVWSRNENTESKPYESLSGCSGLATIFRRNCLNKQFAAIYVADDAIHLWINNTDFQISENSHALIAFDSMLGNRFTLYSGLLTVVSVTFDTGFADLNDYDDWDYEPSFWEYVAEVISDRHQRKAFSFVWSALAKGKRRPETGCDYASPERLKTVRDPFDTTCDIEDFDQHEPIVYDKSAEEDLTRYVDRETNVLKSLRPSTIAIILILVSIFVGIAADTISSKPNESIHDTAGDTSQKLVLSRAKALHAVSTPDGYSNVGN